MFVQYAVFVLRSKLSEYIEFRALRMPFQFSCNTKDRFCTMYCIHFSSFSFLCEVGSLLVHPGNESLVSPSPYLCQLHTYVYVVSLVPQQMAPLHGQPGSSSPLSSGFGSNHAPFESAPTTFRPLSRSSDSGE